MRKCTIFVAIAVIVTCLFETSVSAVSFNPKINLHSDAVYMINLDEDRVVYKKNENKQLYPASLTKIMTAIIALEKFQDNIDALDKTFVTAKSESFDATYREGGSHAQIQIGQKINYKDLLYGLMLRSGCEAADIIAYDIGNGDFNKFAQMMNQKAKEIGANNTHYVNAQGFFNKAQYTTASDMAKIVKYAMSLKMFNKIVNSPFYTMPANSVNKKPYLIRHTNRMLLPNSMYYYKYAKGIKTGWVPEAGKCLVSTAEKDGVSYLLVTMKAPNKNKDGASVDYACIDHKNLYQWAFNKLKPTALIEKETEVDDIEVLYGKNAFSVNLKPAEECVYLWNKDIPTDSIIKEAVFEDNTMAPVKKGDKLGKYKLTYNGELIFETDLIATEDIKRDEFSYRLSLAQTFFESPIFIMALVACVIAVILYFIIFSVKSKKRKKKYKRVNRRINRRF